MLDAGLTSTISVPDLDRYISTLSDCKPLSEQEVRHLCEKAREVFYNESNVQPVRCPVTVVGDLYDTLSCLSYTFIGMGSFMISWRCFELVDVCISFSLSLNVM